MSQSSGFKVWGQASLVVLALLAVGGLFSKNYLNSPNIQQGDGSQTAGRDINTGNTTNNNTDNSITNNQYGSPDSLLVSLSDSQTVIPPYTKPMESKVSPSEYALQVRKPSFGNITEESSPDEKNLTGVMAVKPGEEYELDFVVDYRSQDSTKFYANLKPDVDDQQMYEKAHLDNIKALGRPLKGDGTLRFKLRGKAPLEKGVHGRAITMGLMNAENWDLLVHYQFPFALLVE